MPGGSKIKHTLKLFFLILDPNFIYMSHQYMAIDRGGFKWRRGGRVPP